MDVYQWNGFFLTYFNDKTIEKLLLELDLLV